MEDSAEGMCEEQREGRKVVILSVLNEQDREGN
nr:MAG TPA: hypothetical protein [Caudoviricetes sp.]